MKMFEALGRALAIESKVAFGLLGDGNMYTMSAYAETPGTRLIQGRHENAVVAMADGYARASGGVGLCTVIDGPGITQVSTSLVIAVQHRVPLVLFAGDAPLSQSYNIHGYDQRALAAATGARFVQPGTGGRVLEACQEAFMIARTRQMPVVLSVPSDLQEEELSWDFDYQSSVDLVPPRPRLLAPEDDIRAVLDRIGKAERPVIIAGLGAVKSGADAALVEFGERIGALLGTSIRAKGMFGGHEFDLGIAGAFANSTARSLLVDSDCVIGVGSGLGHFTSEGGYLYPAADRIQIDVDPVGLHTGQQVADVYLQGDARATIEQMIALSGPTARTGYRTRQVAELLSHAREGLVASCKPSTGGDGAHPMEAMLAIDNLVDSTTNVVINVGHSWAFPLMAFSHLRPRNFFVLDDFGVIGQALAAAIGVAVARPDKPVLCVDGDGSLLMQVQEFETVVREKIDLSVLVLNDGAYGAEVHKMDAKGLNGQLTSFGRPRFVDVARAFGGDGECVGSLEPLPSALERTLKGAGLRVLDLWTDGTVASPAYNRLYFGAAGE